MLDLSNIELINVSIKDVELGVKSLIHSSRNIKFGRKVIYTHIRPTNLPGDIEWVKIEPVSISTMDYFHTKILSTYQELDYMISIHTDGFIINPDNWSEDFKKYDYIGAPWPDLHWNKINRVGNGGFVMKSRKFTNIESQLDYIVGQNDWVVTNYYYDLFVGRGCKYAPVEVAAKFSLELPIPEVAHDLTTSFGFHGTHSDQAKEMCKLLEQYE